jgi:hypothetical protein
VRPNKELALIDNCQLYISDHHGKGNATFQRVGQHSSGFDMLARVLHAAARPMGAMARPSGPLPVAMIGVRWGGQGGHSSYGMRWDRRWSAAAATDVEYRDRPDQQPVTPIEHGTTRLETLVDPGSLFKVRLGDGASPRCLGSPWLSLGSPSDERGRG